MPFIETKIENHIGTILFANEPRRNALSSGLIAEVLAALDQFTAAKVRVAVLRASGTGKVWSAGHDVTELPQEGVDPLPYQDPLEQLLRGIKHFPGPVIAMVHGSVWGGACELVMACDIVIADESSAFAITPAKLGLPYNAAGITNFLSRLPLNIVKEMFFTADLIPASRAESVGIINALVPAAELESRTYAMAKTIATRSPQSIAQQKETMRILAESAAISPATYEYLQGLRRAVYCGADYREGIRAFMEKRPPQF